MARLEMRIEYESFTATKVLKTANTFLKLLKSIERETTGRHATIPWQIDILSGARVAIIVLRSDIADSMAFATDTANEAIKRMEKAL